MEDHLVCNCCTVGGISPVVNFSLFNEAVHCTVVNFIYIFHSIIILGYTRCSVSAVHHFLIGNLV